MSFFSRIFGRKQRREDAVVGSGVSGVDLGSVVSSLISVNGDRALGVTAYKRALDVLSGSVARLPFRYMRLKGGIYDEDEGSPLHYLLTVQPQQRMNAFEWKRQLVWRAMHDGNAYVYPRYIEGRVAELVLLGRGTCSHDAINGRYYVTDLINGVSGTFDESEMIHIMFNSQDGQTGDPLWQIGRRALSIIATADNETLDRFASSGMVRGLITNDRSGIRGLGEYQSQQLKNVAKATEDMFRESNIVSLPGDVDFKQISLSSSDMQFLESRKFAILEISRLTGVPPIYLYDMAGSNYKMPEQADVAYLTQTLDVLLTGIETEFRRKLIPQSLCCKRIFSFDRKRVFSMDLTSMANYEAKMLQNGVMSVNDIRRMENQPAVEGGDKIYISTNMAELGSAKLASSAPA